MEYGLGAHVHPGVGKLPGVGSAGYLNDRATGQGLEFLPHAGHSSPQVPEPGRPTSVAHHRSAVTADAAGQHPIAVLSQGHPVLLTAGQRPATVAGQEAGPAPTVQDTHHRAVAVGAEHGYQGVAEQAGPSRVVGATINKVDHRPAGPLLRPGRHQKVPPGESLEAG